MKKISIVVPMYYEEKIVSECYCRLTSVLKNIENYEYEIIFINDGSKDKTLEMLIDLVNNTPNNNNLNGIIPNILPTSLGIIGKIIVRNNK